MLVSQIANKGVVLSHAGPRGEAPGPAVGRGGEENCGQESSLCFPGKEHTRQGKQAYDCLAGVDGLSLGGRNWALG